MIAEFGEYFNLNDIFLTLATAFLTLEGLLKYCLFLSVGLCEIPRKPSSTRK
jgi:hypothetical protein